MEHYLNAFKQFFDFSGRATRTQYWMFFLIHLVVSVLLTLVDYFVLGSGLENGTGLLGGIYGLVAFIPGLAIAVRRLHDTGRTGFWILIALIPLLGFLLLILFFIQGSKPNANNWGDPVVLSEPA